MSTVTVVATAESGHYPPRVKLDVTDTGSSPEVFAATVMRLDPDGQLRPVRTPDGNPLPLVTSGATRVGTVYDYEVRPGAPTTYTTLETPGSSSVPVTITDRRVWLVHLSSPSLSMPIDLHAESLAEEEWAVDQGVHWPMSGEFPVVQTAGVRKAPATSITVRTKTPVEHAQLKALLKDASVLLFNVPDDLGLGVDSCYIAVGSVRNRRPVNIGTDPRRAVELPYQVVDRPIGGTQADRTLADLMDYPTLNSLMAAYSTFNALLAGP